MGIAILRFLIRKCIERKIKEESMRCSVVVSALDVALRSLGHQVGVVRRSRYGDGLSGTKAGVAHVICDRLQHVGAPVVIVAQNVVVRRLRCAECAEVAECEPVVLNGMHHVDVDRRSGGTVPCFRKLL